MALRMGRPPAVVSRWDPADVVLLAAQIRRKDKMMDRRFGRLMQWIAAQGGVKLEISQTFASLADEKVEVVDDGSRAVIL